MSDVPAGGAAKGESKPEISTIPVFEAIPVPPKGNKPQEERITRMLMEFSGPMPHPEVLAGYERICPGAADRMLAIVEREGTHRRETETKMVDAEIKLRNRQLDESRLGQFCALVIVLAGLGSGGWLGFNGHELTGGILGVGGIGGIVALFLGRHRPEHESREPQKSAPPQQAKPRKNRK